MNALETVTVGVDLSQGMARAIAHLWNCKDTSSSEWTSRADGSRACASACSALHLPGTRGYK